MPLSRRGYPVCLLIRDPGGRLTRPRGPCYKTSTILRTSIRPVITTITTGPLIRPLRLTTSSRSENVRVANVIRRASRVFYPCVLASPFFRESSLLFHHPKSGECYFREKFSRIDERRWNLSSRLIYFMNKRFTRCRARVFVTGCRMAASNSGFCGVRGDKLSEEERCGEVLKMLGNFRRRLRASRDARNTF